MEPTRVSNRVLHALDRASATTSRTNPVRRACMSSYADAHHARTRRRHRPVAGQSRYARRADAARSPSLPRRIPRRPARGAVAALAVVAAAAWRDPAVARVEGGEEVRRDLDGRRLTAGGVHARARRRGAAAAAAGSRGACDALWQAGARAGLRRLAR